MNIVLFNKINSNITLYSSILNIYTNKVYPLFTTKIDKDKSSDSQEIKGFNHETCIILFYTVTNSQNLSFLQAIPYNYEYNEDLTVYLYPFKKNIPLYASISENDKDTGYPSIYTYRSDIPPNKWSIGGPCSSDMVSVGSSSSYICVNFPSINNIRMVNDYSTPIVFYISLIDNLGYVYPGYALTLSTNTQYDLFIKPDDRIIIISLNSSTGSYSLLPIIDISNIKYDNMNILNFNDTQVDQETIKITESVTEIGYYKNNINSAISITDCNKYLKIGSETDYVCFNPGFITPMLTIVNKYGQNLKLYLVSFDENEQIIAKFYTTLAKDASIGYDVIKNNNLMIIFQTDDKNYGLFSITDMIGINYNKTYELILTNTSSTNPKTTLVSPTTNLPYLSNDINSYISQPPCKENTILINVGDPICVDMLGLKDYLMSLQNKFNMKMVLIVMGLIVGLIIVIIIIIIIIKSTSKKSKSKKINSNLQQTNSNQINPPQKNIPQTNPSQTNPSQINPSQTNPSQTNPSQINQPQQTFSQTAPSRSGFTQPYMTLPSLIIPN